jgi:outer membrane receptor for ferrienterochelin and colicins
MPDLSNVSAFGNFFSLRGISKTPTLAGLFQNCLYVINHNRIVLIRPLLHLIYCFLIPVSCLCQAGDTIRSRQHLREVTVKGDRLNKRDDLIEIGKLAQPVTLVNKKTIEMMGSRRLDEVLREQTGMALVSDLGSGNRSLGLQMQGFSAEYIMILINGLPMTGRFNGNFDLSRLSVSGIERIEIIRGASSSLYGSEALGGVINIITKQTGKQAGALAGVRYGSYNTLDASLEGQTPVNGEKGAANLSANYYRTDGFNVNTAYLTKGQTGPPYNSLNLQGRASYKLSEANTLQLSAHFGGRNSVMERAYTTQQFNDALEETDLNTALSLNSRLANGIRLLSRYYFTRYATDQQVRFHQNGGVLQENRFVQSIHRAELQAARDMAGEKLSLVGGAGAEHQQMNNHQEGTGNGMYTYFGYFQAIYRPSDRYDFVTGVRYDGNNVYGGRFNPTIGASYRPADWLKLKFSAGQGFKAPTYAQMYQVFTNIVQGYTVIGANVFSARAQAMKDAGAVQQLWPVAGNIKPLRPETSTSLNLGLSVYPFSSVEYTLNGFYNNIRNQIFTQQAGIMSNGQQLYSYFNVERSFTTGAESSIRWTPADGLTVSAGYQYLIAKDQGIIDSIKAGQGRYAKVRADGGIRNAAAADYFNLPNRSRHSLNAQVFYEYRPLGLGISLRGNYRGKYGFMDIDNNGYIDPYDVYVPGYFLGYAAASKKMLHDRLVVQLSVDNIFNYTDYLMPAQPGRMIMAGISWRFSGKQSRSYESTSAFSTK